MDKKRPSTKSFKLDMVQLVPDQGYTHRQPEVLILKQAYISRWVREY